MGQVCSPLLPLHPLHLPPRHFYGDDARDRGRGNDEETDAVLRSDPDVRGQVLMDTAT
jgi:hypothetical protein